VVAPVVVRDARVRVEDRRRLVGATGARAHGDQAGLVAQPPGVEDRGHLPDDPLGAQRFDPLQHLVLLHPERLPQGGEGSLDERQVVLERVQEQAVAVIHARQCRPGFVAGMPGRVYRHVRTHAVIHSRWEEGCPSSGVCG
jgi:hypothetical protein